MTIETTTGLISVYTANSAAVGTHTASVTAKLANYLSGPTITATFQITIEKCIVTFFTMLDLSPVIHIIYQIADP